MTEAFAVPVTLRPSKAKMALLFIVSLLFVFGGILMMRDGERAGYFVSAFFALCLLVAAIQFLPNASYLLLTPEGFTFCSLFRAHTVKWNDVEWFSVVEIGGRKMVGWNPIPGVRPHARLRAFNLKAFGLEEALPDTYGLRPEVLADILNDLREKHALR
jgi:hypothetical protein